MTAIKLTAVVDESRKLVIDLPTDVPLGPVELTITPHEPVAPAQYPAREAARAKLLAAGIPLPTFDVPEGMTALSPEALLEAGRLPTGAPTSEALIDADRGER
jgi:hypothetical protein